jgi:hypothetical protein
MTSIEVEVIKTCEEPYVAEVLKKEGGAGTMNTHCPDILFPRLRRSGRAMGMAEVYFMQKTLLIISTLLTVPFFGSAAPAPGCADPIPAGTWRGRWCHAYPGDRYLLVSDGLTYGISGSGYEIWPDSTGQWDWIEPYSAYISLTNAPGTPWYSAGDTNVNFEFQTSMLLKVRGPQIPSTNAADAYLEMELSAQDGRFIFLATYAGTPSATYFPEDIDTLPRTEATAPLSWARLCIDSAEGDPTIPLTIRGLLTPSSQVELCWSSAANKLYQLQCCSDLSERQWTNLGSPIAGTGANRRVVDAVESQRFYRVLEFP